MFRLHVEGINVVYSTADRRAHDWFYPRYENGEVHEPAMTYRLLGDLKGSSCFFDVGAFIGFYTCLAAKIVSGRVHAFEMDPHNARLLQKNVALNGADNVVVHRCAVGDTSGRGVYMRGADDFGAGHRLMRGDSRPLLRRAASRLLRQRATEVVTLDDLDDQPNVIKIDVEGAELSVLKGMRRILSEAKDLRLYIELHPGASDRLYGATPDDVVSLLDAANFECFEVGQFRRDAEAPLMPVRTPTKIRGNSMLYARRRQRK